MPVNPREHCKDCDDYRERVEIAEKINEIFGTDGICDFRTCYLSCVKRFDKKTLYDRVKSTEYYHARHPEARRLV
jgi:hypothetical protein